MVKPFLSFVWQGVSDPTTFNKWNDGLRHAIILLEQEYEIEYREPWDELNGDIILYWEAPCTAHGENAPHYNKVRQTNKPKALLFAGGPIESYTHSGFDLIFVENECVRGEFRDVDTIVAFGVNTKDFKPRKKIKKYDAFFHATFAEWKRHQLFADTFGSRGSVAGRLQTHDRNGYNRCQALGVNIFPEADAQTLSKYIAEAHCVVNTSEFWGGGQRTTLEALACNAPVVVMSDSPKNREYIEESGQGIIVNPEPEAIKNAVLTIKKSEKYRKGRGYVEKKWTPKHYAENLKKGIKQL